MSEMVTRELKQIVFKAMRQLKTEHRTVLTLRCYEEMEYSQIAESMRCSEFAAQMLFYRAKKALKKQLARQGLGKGSLLMALVLFGKMTAPTEAAVGQVVVTAASIKVGVGAALLGMAASKTAVVSLTTAGVLAVGTIVATSGPDKTIVGGGKELARGSGLGRQVSLARKADEEYWYFFPEGTDGPLMTRLMKGNSKGKGYYCQQMQDEHANYRFDPRKNTIYINNARHWHSDLSVWQLPTDEAPLREFVWKLQDSSEQIEYVSSDEPGFMAVVRRGQNGSSLWTTHHYHVLKEEYFRYSLPADARVVDKRDAMHKRGWTYFTVTGAIGGKTITGTGRMPFFYATRKEHGPWLRLSIGNEFRVVDTVRAAAVYRDRDRTTATYPAGTFFKGLPRPWMGLHTIDTVRRDAAAQGMRFDTEYTPKSAKAEVVLTRGQDKLIYTIDTQKDVIDKIAFSTGGEKRGELRFSYLEEVDEKDDEFVEPHIRGYRPTKAPKGILWLKELATSPQE
jgi:hypothetical protein